MTDDRLGRALRSVGDRYLTESPADYEAFRHGVRRRSRRRGLVWGLAAGTATTAALVAVLFVVPRDAAFDREAPQQPAGAVGLALAERIEIASASSEIAGIGGSAFVALREGSSVLRVDPGNGEPSWETPLASEPFDILEGAAAAWVSLPGAGQVARIEPGTGAPRYYDLAPFTNPTRMHAGAYALRVVADQGVLRMSYASRSPELIYEGSVADIAMGKTALWILRSDGVVEGIDPDSGADAGLLKTTLGVGGEITFLREKIWMGLPHAPNLYRLDETTGEIEGVSDLPGDYVDIDAGADGLWVLTADENGGAVTELDAATGEIGERTFRFASTPLDLSHDESGIWVSLANGTVVLLEND